MSRRDCLVADDARPRAARRVLLLEIFPPEHRQLKDSSAYDLADRPRDPNAAADSTLICHARNVPGLAARGGPERPAGPFSSSSGPEPLPPEPAVAPASVTPASSTRSPTNGRIGPATPAKPESGPAAARGSPAPSPTGPPARKSPRFVPERWAGPSPLEGDASDAKIKSDAFRPRGVAYLGLPLQLFSAQRDRPPRSYCRGGRRRPRALPGFVRPPTLGFRGRAEAVRRDRRPRAHQRAPRGSSTRSKVGPNTRRMVSTIRRGVGARPPATWRNIDDDQLRSGGPADRGAASGDPLSGSPRLTRSRARSTAWSDRLAPAKHPTVAGDDMPGAGPRTSRTDSWSRPEGSDARAQPTPTARRSRALFVAPRVPGEDPRAATCAALPRRGHPPLWARPGAAGMTAALRHSDGLPIRATALRPRRPVRLGWIQPCCGALLAA